MEHLQEHSLWQMTLRDLEKNEFLQAEDFEPYTFRIAV